VRRLAKKQHRAFTEGG